MERIDEHGASSYELGPDAARRYCARMPYAQSRLDLEAFRGWTAKDSARFWAKVDRSGGADACWLWHGAFCARHPYGKIKFSKATRYAHHVTIGAIPNKGFVVDHLCRNTLCVNPAHLDVVTVYENVVRGKCSMLKTHCRNGHEYSPGNVIMQDGHRRCAICRRQNMLAHCERMKKLRVEMDPRGFSYRGGRPKLLGENHPNAIMTNVQVIEIKKRLRNGIKKSVIAHEVGVPCNLVYNVASGRVWKSVEAEHD